MSGGDVLALVRGAVALVLEVDPADVQPGTRLAEDLRADSLALIEIVEVLEERLRSVGVAVHVEDDEIERLVTVGDAVDLTMGRL